MIKLVGVCLFTEKKRFFLKTELSEIQKIKKIWGDLKPPIFDNQIIINSSKLPPLNKTITILVRIVNYKTPLFSNKKLVFKELIPS